LSLHPGLHIPVDLDSTAITRYGNQEGNNIGYNPGKRGRPSHLPLFAFLGNERMDERTKQQGVCHQLAVH